MVTIIYGEKQVAPPRPKSTENELYGPGWNATRTDGKCILESAWGGHGGGSIIFEIDEADFELLKSDFSQWSGIYDRYSLIHGEGWWADRNPDLRYVRVQPNKGFDRVGDFHITEEEFLILRKDHSFFKELYKKYYSSIKNAMRA
jgi:hypothetical protein